MDGESLFGISQRLPPANNPAEQALLGAILANNRAYEMVAEFLQPSHFSDPVHAKIYEAIVNRIQRGHLADAVTLRGDLGHSLDEVGGAAYLAQLLVAMVSIKNAAAYGRAIFDAWVRRSLIEVGTDLVNESFEGITEPPDMTSAAFGRMTEIIEGSGATKGISLDDAIKAALSTAEAAYQGGGPTGISTGMPKIDGRLAGGMRPGNLIVLGARPGMGKTALAVKIAVNRAREAKRLIDAARAAGVTPDPKTTAGVLVISLEMTAEELAVRVLSYMSGISSIAIMNGDLQQRDFDRLVSVSLQLKDLPITIEDAPGQDVETIAVKAQIAKRKHGLSLLVVDHLQIVRTDARDDKSGPTLAVGKVSGGMKRLAKKMGIPVLLLAQLSRGLEGRDEKRPQLSDLKYSGDIEADADVVVFLYRPEYYLSKTEPERRENESVDRWQERIEVWRQSRVDLSGKAELIASKVRGGSPGVVDLTFHGPTMNFQEAVDE